MNLKNWMYLFWTTLAVGAAGSLIVGLLMQWTDTLDMNGATDILVNIAVLLGVGAMVSVYSQMGFFAYLMLNYMGNGVFSRRTWQYIQLGLALLAWLELMFFRLFVGREGKGSSDIIFGVILLVIAVGVGYFKVKMTHSSAWIPTLFFMTAFTILEIVGVLKIGVDQATLWIAAPLIACNAYQILILHRVLKPQNTYKPPQQQGLANE
ncbi:KinB-signaling pathway activation protein [Paenibacillus brevis]|uniref:KinB-signaling pathway activation protein n=1 Tax=Paenibacillus brevis TaxID=2841508 RepID=A0ABS6FVC8_9BACL|nr:KinB-signaling pathway activation protein [Paenibacillus brevis]MBU5674180.1 KinB-signaling pathway activation protein [Paenibacillus brevis]